MKRSTKIVGVVLVLAGSGVASGCAASAPPPRDLVEARASYQRIAASPDARVKPEVAKAKMALDRAEASYADDPSGDATRDYSYVAARKTSSALAKQNAVIAIDDGKVAEVELQGLRTQMQAMQRGELDKTRAQLESERAALSSEKQARAAAEEKTKDALTKIAGMQSAETTRGLVLTLSGAVLFGTGKSELLPAAQARLKEAANAIREDKRSVIIVGHTDSTGSDEINQALSLKRAEAVRNYLVTHGVPADRVKAEGAGKTQPIADNMTTEGRASNRRVEIILEHEK